jgi:hypothetical protein
MKLLLAITILLFIPAQTRLTAADAAKHIGETATVCGTVASARYAESSNRKPTFLNLVGTENSVRAVSCWTIDMQAPPTYLKLRGVAAQFAD